MFGFGKKKEGPPAIDANPGEAVEGDVDFSNGQKSWTEHFNMTDLTDRVLKSGGHAIKRHDGWLEHPASGFMLVPLLVDLSPKEDGGVQTCTTIQINHPTLAPNGIFEYQHSIGDSLAESICEGIDQWMQVDFVTLLDALQSETRECTTLQMEFPESDGHPARIRRAVLGPVAHMMTEPPPPEEKPVAEPVDEEACDADHDFCPCCLLTRSLDAFMPLMEGDGLYAIRMFAARNQDGSTDSDCRVNGEDFEPGAAALREYATTWPNAGVEFRKQYVVLHTAG